MSELPSNKKFGLFFSFIFFALTIYGIGSGDFYCLTIFAVAATITFSVTLIKPAILQPFNKSWMRLGYILGMIVSPVVLLILYGITIAPFGIVMRCFGRDQLRIKKTRGASHWLVRKQSDVSPNFKQQF